METTEREQLHRLIDERDDLLRFMSTVNEELVLLGFQGGDRKQILKNIRSIRELMLNKNLDK